MRVGELYDYPEYYDAAFCSFRDVKHEADVIDECIHRYSRIPVESILELACGPAPNAEELVSRGYRYLGLDLQPAMVRYCREKYRKSAGRPEFVEGDMLDFRLPSPVDFVLVMAGSLFPKSSVDILSHFACVAESLRPGGIYLLDSCIQTPENLEQGTKTYQVTGTAEQLYVTMSSRWLDFAAQIIEYSLRVVVEGGKERLDLRASDRFRVMFPQEFLLLLEKAGRFEFLGWWSDWNLSKPMEGSADIVRPLLLLRRI